MMTNCTVFGNSVSNLDAYGGGIWNEGTAVLISCTVPSNSCTAGSGGLAEGGGIYNPGTMALGNTILAGNSAFLLKPQFSPDGRGTFVSYGYNLVGETNGSRGWGSIGDRLGTAGNPLNPLLGPLANNGGPTPPARFCRAARPWTQATVSA
jgi:hypothetical protein